MTYCYRTEGFVFKKDDVFEADRIFSVFTRDFGKIEVLGRSIRKIASKLKGGVEIFSLSEIEFVQGRNKRTLTDALLIENFKNIYDDPEKISIACKIADVLADFIKGEEQDEKIFNLLKEVFSKLNDSQFLVFSAKQDHRIISLLQLIYYYFFWNFMKLLGYKPELFQCVLCQYKLNPYGLYFSYKEGGIICKTCATANKDGVKIKSDLVKILRLIIKEDWAILSRLKIEESVKKSLKEISNNYSYYLLPNL